MKSNCGGNRLDFKIRKMKDFQFKILHVVTFFIQNLTRCENFELKSDALQKFCLKI